MKYADHEFDPVTPEQEAERAADEEFKRRVREEVRRMNSGEADEDLRRDEEREAAARAAEEERLRREQKRQASALWQLLSGTILIREGVSKYYSYMFCVAGMFFLSIAVMFMTLHLDMKYTRLEREVTMLREKSIRLQEQRFRRTTHSAISNELHRRGLDLYDPHSPGVVIED